MNQGIVQELPITGPGNRNPFPAGGYPKELLAVSVSNQRACKRFMQAQEVFAKGDFKLADRFMQGYRNLVRYDEFYIHDNRIEKSPMISVVIVAYNTKWDLIKCLKSVFSGSVKKIEVIVVDNGENAEVISILLSMPILYIKTPMNLVLSEGRNIGVAMARAPVVAFLDDDGIADKDFCRHALTPFQDENIFAVRGKVLPKTADAFQSGNRHYDFGDEPLPHCINTEGNSAWRVESYRQVGGMDPLLFGHEGTDMSIRYTQTYGWGKTWYWPSLVLYHDYAATSDKSEAKKQRDELMFRFLFWKNPEAQAFLQGYGRLVKEFKSAKKVTLPPLIPRKKRSIKSPQEPASVCFFVPTLGAGGAERQVVTLAKVLATVGKSVQILCFSVDGADGHYLDSLKNSNVQCRALNKQDLAFGQAFMEHSPERFRAIASLQIDHTAVCALAGALRQIKPDSLHCYLDDASCIGGCAGLACAVPGIILSSRSTTPDKFPELNSIAAWTHTAYAFLLQHDNVLLEANSSAGAEDYERWLALSPGSIRINMNGFEAATFDVEPKKTRSAIRHSLNIPGTAPLVIWIGKYNSVKAPDVMVKVAALVRDKIPEVKFLAVGSLYGREEQFHALLNEYRLRDTVVFAGVRQDITDVLHASDALLLTSNVEGFPNVVLEAMVAGLPVVSTIVGAVPDMLSPETGLLYPIGDAAGLADGLIRLLSTDTLRQTMGTRARQRATKLFTVDALVNRAIQNYKDAMANGNA